MFSDLLNFIRAKIRYVFPILIILAVLSILNMYSAIVVIDPTAEQTNLTRPFDLVIARQGTCGTINESTFRAVLNQGQANERDITSLFGDFDKERQLWKIREFDPGNTGVFTLSVSAELELPHLCLHVDPDQEVTLNVADSLTDGAFTSQLHEGEDVDYFTLQAPASSDFGRWFGVKLLATAPSNYEFSFGLVGPKKKEGEGGESDLGTEKTSSAILWVALQSGVSAKVRIAKEGLFDNYNSVGYRLEILSQRIIDPGEPNNDIKANATPLDHNQLTSYMAGVLGAEEEPLGLRDWYVIQHHDCIVDCFTVSPAYDLDYCKDPEENSCSGGGIQTNALSLCTNKAGSMNEEGDGERYFLVECSSANCPVHGISSVSRQTEIAVPARYKETYSVRWNEACHYTYTEINECDRRNSCLTSPDSQNNVGVVLPPLR